MNAIDFLCKEHDRVRKMLMDISEGSHFYETKKKLFHTLSHDLLRHEEMEHKVWYPCFKEKLDKTVKHLISEENHAEQAIKRFKHLRTEAEWEKEFTKFKHDVEHHAREEEHNLFPRVEKLLTEKELDEIGKKMYEFKKAHAEKFH